MNQTITTAIRERHLLEFTYKGKVRVVEPHTYGRQISGEDALCAWQTSGGSGMDFRLFLLRDVSACSALTQTFPGPRDGYARNDKRFSIVFAQL